jgi:hypothetical protein
MPPHLRGLEAPRPRGSTTPKAAFLKRLVSRRPRRLGVYPVSSMDEGDPISYRLLERRTAVWSGDGREIGTVAEVLATGLRGHLRRDRDPHSEWSALRRRAGGRAHRGAPRDALDQLFRGRATSRARGRPARVQGGSGRGPLVAVLRRRLEAALAVVPSSPCSHRPRPRPGAWSYVSSCEFAAGL